MNRNKWINIMVCCSLVLSLFVASPVLASEKIRVALDGDYLDFDVPPVLIEGRTLVPLRAIFEALGSTVNWDAETQTVTGSKDDSIVTLQVGSKQASVDGELVILDVPAKLIDGRTLVPLRFIAESMGADVQWDGPSNMVTIQSKSQDVFGAPTGVKVSQISDTALVLSWDQVFGADSYRVLSSVVSENYSEEDSNNYSWNEGACVFYYDMIPGESYSYQVTAVKGDTLSDYSEEVMLTLIDHEITQEDFASIQLDLIRNESVLQIDGKSIIYSDIEGYWFEEGNFLGITFSFNTPDNLLEDMSELLTDYREEIEFYYADVAKIISDIYDVDVNLVLQYEGVYNEYPEAFEESNLANVILQGGDNLWLVYYPFLFLEYPYLSENYYITWADEGE
ncbi:hypothetical protein JR334_00170 [Clostridia bacterium]|nr:hypothetical protein JR334_00170 [Clostridia bacterium]